MKEREFKKLVFENFVQAKKELIREGYIKRSDNLNFEDVFSETKKRVLEERVKSLQRENEMLKKQIKRKGLREAGVSNPTGYGERGSDALDNRFRQFGMKFFDNPTDKLTDVAVKLGIKSNSREFDRLNAMLGDFIKKDKLNSPEKIEKAIELINKLDSQEPSDYYSALVSGIDMISKPQLTENRRRRY
jgi:thymidylate synthase ThyX